MIRVGIVGTGGMGTVHRTNYQYIEGCLVAAVCGNQEKAREWGVPGYREITRMAREERLDLIDICTPTYLHYGQVKEALKLCSVICEKPLALTSREAEDLFRTAEEYGHHLYVAQVLRFFPEYKILEKMVKEGSCGRMLDGYFWRLSSKPAWTSGGWMTDRKKSGLVPYDLHIHDLDFAVSLFGMPKKYQVTAARGPEDEMAQQYRFCYEFENAGTVHMCAEAAWYRGNYTWSAGYRVCFERGVLEARDGKAVLYREGQEPRELDTSQKRLIPTGINVPPTGVYLEELEHFVSCARRNVDSEIVRREQVTGVLSLLERIDGEGEL